VDTVRLELARLLLDKIELVSARTQNSIGLTFYCRTSTALRRLVRLVDTGALRAAVSAIFNALLISDSPDVSVYELAWNKDVLRQALKHFDGTGKFNEYFICISSSLCTAKIHNISSEITHSAGNLGFGFDVNTE